MVVFMKIEIFKSTENKEKDTTTSGSISFDPIAFYPFINRHYKYLMRCYSKGSLMSHYAGDTLKTMISKDSSYVANRISVSDFGTILAKGYDKICIVKSNKEIVELFPEEFI